MSELILLTFVVQVFAISIDEFYFHRIRRLPLWERISHPIDTMLFTTCISISLFLPPHSPIIEWYIIIAILSTLLITKDEFIHPSLCSPAEHWIHSILFILHPIVLIEVFIFWTMPQLFSTHILSILQIGLKLLFFFSLLFLFFQIVFWGVYDKQRHFSKTR